MSAWSPVLQFVMTELEAAPPPEPLQIWIERRVATAGSAAGAVNYRFRIGPWQEIKEMVSHEDYDDLSEALHGAMDCAVRVRGMVDCEQARLLKLEAERYDNFVREYPAIAQRAAEIAQLRRQQQQDFTGLDDRP